MSRHAWDNMRWHSAHLLLIKVIHSWSCYVGLIKIHCPKS